MFKKKSIKSIKSSFTTQMLMQPPTSQTIQKLLKTDLYSIEPAMTNINKATLSLAYTPGVGTICMDIFKDPKLLDKYTFRGRSAAIVTDGSLLNASPKNFMPAMDWFVFQIKHYSGIDAYPFVVMKEANVSEVVKNLANSYSIIIYLDNKENIEVPSDVLFIRHKRITGLSNSELTDARNTANVVGYLKSKEFLGQPTEQQYKTSIVAPSFKLKTKNQPFEWEGDNIDLNARRFHQQYQGKIYIKLSQQNIEDLRQVFNDKNLREVVTKDHVYSKTSKVAVIVTDGTAILGLGNIGPRAGLPVMEGKSLLFKILGGVDVVPFCINPYTNVSQQIQLIKNSISNFMAVNLQDIKAPECFDIEESLKQMKLLPVFHDDQHGTAIVTLAALINALRVAGKKIENIKIVINGAGAAGITIAKLLKAYGATNMIVCDTKGAIYEGRKQGMNQAKHQVAAFTNLDKQAGSLQKVIEGSDVFIGVSSAGALKGPWVKTMRNPIIFALANPVPEIFPDEAKNNGAFIYGSGRSDFENQINNSLVFPGIFKGIKEHNIKEVTMQMKLKASEALAKCLDKQADPCYVIPSSLDSSIGSVISDEIGKQWVPAQIKPIEPKI